jgi:hypothetical protein
MMKILQEKYSANCFYGQHFLLDIIGNNIPLRQHHDSSWWEEAEGDRSSLAPAFHHDESWCCLNMKELSVFASHLL